MKYKVRCESPADSKLPVCYEYVEVQTGDTNMRWITGNVVERAREVSAKQPKDGT